VHPYFVLVGFFNYIAIYHMYLIMHARCYFDLLLTCVFVNFNRIIGIIIKEIETNIAKNTFLANFRMSALPVLCKKFVELVSILVSSVATPTEFQSYSRIILEFFDFFWIFFVFLFF
jgi:hypothetical protein